MAKQRTKQKRKVPNMKLDDTQKTINENVDATTRSFEGATKATQAIAAEVADYTRRSFEHGAKERPSSARFRATSMASARTMLW
jgi:hypothetical protein